MNKEVKSILGNEIIVDKVKIHVEHLKYKGNKKTFITWKLLDETPELCANDDDLCSVCPLDIDIYSDKNYSHYCPYNLFYNYYSIKFSTFKSKSYYHYNSCN